MITKSVIIGSSVGLHARPASVFSKTAKSFGCKIEVRYGNRTINGKSAIHLVTLNAKFGSEVCVIADGTDELEAITTLTKILENKDL